MLEKLTREKLAKENVGDLGNLLLGVALFVSPWALGFSAEPTPSWNAWLSGIVIGAIALAALTAFAEWEEWINLLAGVWVAISPWLAAFAAHVTAMRVHLVIGIIVAVVAALRLWLVRSGTPRVTA